MSYRPPRPPLKPSISLRPLVAGFQILCLGFHGQLRVGLWIFQDVWAREGMGPRLLVLWMWGFPLAKGAGASCRGALDPRLLGHTRSSPAAPKQRPAPSHCRSPVPFSLRTLTTPPPPHARTL